MFDLQGSINVLDPQIIPTQSCTRIRCTIFVNVIDLVVSAVVEQVYIQQYFMQEICPLKLLIFTSKCTKMRLVAGPCPDDPLGELTSLLRFPSWVKGERKGRGVGKGKWQGRPEAPPAT